MVRSCAASMAYWRRRGRQATQPLRGPRGAGMTLRIPRVQEKTTGGRQVQGNRAVSAPPLRAASQRKRSEDLLNGSVRLICAATRGGEEGVPPT